MANDIATALNEAEAGAGGAVRIEAPPIKTSALKTLKPAMAPLPQPTQSPEAQNVAPSEPEAPTPAPEEESPTPAPEDQGPTPAPEDEAPTPAPSEQSSFPQPNSPDRHLNEGVSLDQHLSESFKAGQHPDQNFLGQLESTLGMSYQGLRKGFQGTATGMILRGKMPEEYSAEERQDKAFKIASKIGAFAGDLPLMAASGMVGAAVGGIEGGTVGSIVPGVGTAIGGVSLAAVSGAATAFAVPPAIIKYLNDMYLKGEVKTPAEFTERLMAQAWETIKGATTGAATAITGGAAGAVAGPLAQFSSEIATMTTVSHALEGHLPTFEDYAWNAAVIGGAHGMGILQPKLMNMMTRTGETPDKIAMEANQDVILKQDLLTGDENTPEAARPLDVKEGNPIPDNFDELSKEDKDKALKGSQISVEPKSDVQEPENKETSADRTDAEKAILSRITDRPEVIKKRMNTDEFIRAYNDDLNPLAILKSVAEQNSNSKLDPSNDFYQQARNYRDYAGKLYRAVAEEVPTFNDPNKTSGEGYLKIRKDIPDGDEEMMNAYLVAKHALDLKKFGKEQGITEKDAKEVIEKNKEKFEPIAQRFYDYKKRVKQYAVDAGLLDPEKSELFDSLYGSHVPLYKLLEVDPITGKNGKPIKLFGEIGSSERQIINPLNSILDNTMAIFKAAEQNRVMQSLVTNPDLIEQGMLREHEEGTPKTDSTVVAWFDGEKKLYDVQPEVAGAIKAMDYQPQFTSLYAKTFAGMFQKAAQGLRLGIMGNPVFAAKHLGRATWVSAIQHGNLSEFGSYLVETMAALKDIYQQNDAYWKFRSSGGATGSAESLQHLIESKAWEHQNDTPMEKLKNFAWPESEDPFVKRAWNAVTSPLEQMAMLTHLADMAPKLSKFKMEGGLEGTPEQQFEAAFKARESSVDITKQGALVKTLSFSQPFLNVDIAGSARAFKAMQDPKVVATALAALTLPEIVNFVINKDDPRYKELPLWRQMAAYNVPLNHWTNASQVEINDIPEKYREYMVRTLDDGTIQINNGWTIPVPRPFALGFVFGAVPHMIMDRWANENPHAFDNLREEVLKYLAPIGATALLNPAIEQLTNHRFFPGGNLVPDRLLTELPAYRYERYTSETAKQISKILGYVPNIFPGELHTDSPMVVDNYIRAWTGTTGTYVTQLIDKGLHVSGIKPAPPEATKDWDQVPYMNQFLAHFDPGRSRAVSDFDENYKESLKIENTIKRNPVDMQLIMAQNPDFVPKLSDTHNAINKMKSAIVSINEDPKMTPNDKAQIIHKIGWMILNAAEQGNDQFYAIKKQLRDNMSKGK